MNHFKKLLLSVSITLVAVLSGCQGQTSMVKAEVREPVSCVQPTSKDLGQAVAEAQSMLSEPSCSGRFFATYEQLLKIGEGDPTPANKSIYGDFLRWAKNEGLIANKQKAQLYTRYFSTVFASLPSEYQMCYYCTDPAMGETKLAYQVDKELMNKQQGMVKIMNDKASYQHSSAIANSIKLRIEAACHACNSKAEMY